MNTTNGPLSTILVPLDGSERAERALPLAERIARQTDSTIVLLHVIRPLTWEYPLSGGMVTSQGLLDEEERAARRYVDQVATGVRTRGTEVETIVEHGDPASAILDAQPGRHVGLVVMASHGRTGLTRFALGSVTDRVLRGRAAETGRGAILVVRPFGEDRSDASLSAALVPLDGSALAEVAFDLLDQLGGRVITNVLLARVVDPERGSGETEDAERYLKEASARLETRLGGRGVRIESAILYGKPAEQIIERAARDRDLVIMATHGRGGIERWAYGSVADRVLRGISMPLLLVRPPLGV
jgi:nucleotide-binding universal stress UspA family protein